MLIAYATAGNGHRSAAEAIAESVRAAGRVAEMADVLDFSDPVFRLFYSDVYQMAGEHSHGICGAMYRLTDISPRNSSIVRIIDRISLNRTQPFADFIKKTAPEAFIATHFLPMSIAARMKRHGQYGGPLFIWGRDGARPKSLHAFFPRSGAKNSSWWETSSTGGSSGTIPAGPGPTIL